MDNKTGLTGLNSLLQSNDRAQSFFGSLPDYVQGGIMLRSDSINTEDDLHECADKVLSEFE